jgi:hypothetical protein
VTLELTEEEAIDPFFWAGEAVEAADAMADGFDSLRRQAASQEDTISKLRKQLQGLVEAKAEHENALLSKFSEALNGKKLKIRDQQRLLAGARVDPDASKCSFPNHRGAREARDPPPFACLPPVHTRDNGGNHLLTSFSRLFRSSSRKDPRSQRKRKPDHPRIRREGSCWQTKGQGSSETVVVVVGP